MKYYYNGQWYDLVLPAFDSLPVGTIVGWASDTIPSDYLLCDGSAVSKNVYSDLYAVIGDTYGSSGNTFNLPNLKGRVPVGKDTSQTEFDTLGETGGSKALQEHNHIMDITTYTQPGGLGYGDRLYNVSANDAVDKTYTTTTRNAGTGNSGNLQPYIVLNYIIKAHPSSINTSEVKNTRTTSETDTYSCTYVNENIPTKSNIIETTTSGNIKCYKYSDGTMIATGYNSSFNISAGSGSPKTFDLPTAFKDTDYVVNASVRDTGAYWSQVAIAGKVVDKDTVQVDTWNDAGATATVSVQFIAIGKWK